VCDLGEARLDLFSDTVATPEATEPYLSSRWPELGEFLYGRYCGSMEYGCKGSVPRRMVYGGWIHEDFAVVKEGLEECGRRGLTGYPVLFRRGEDPGAPPTA